MRLIRVTYVDERTGNLLVIEKADDGLVSPPVVVLREPFVGEVRYSYQASKLAPPACDHCGIEG